MDPRKLRPINEIKKRYEIGFSDYSLALFHPVTTEFDYLEEQINNFCGFNRIRSKLYCYLPK